MVFGIVLLLLTCLPFSIDLFQYNLRCTTIASQLYAMTLSALLVLFLLCMYRTRRDTFIRLLLRYISGLCLLGEFIFYIFYICTSRRKPNVRGGYCENAFTLKDDSNEETQKYVDATLSSIYIYIIVVLFTVLVMLGFYVMSFHRQPVLPQYQQRSSRVNQMLQVLQVFIRCVGGTKLLKSPAVLAIGLAIAISQTEKARQCYTVIRNKLTRFVARRNNA